MSKEKLKEPVGYKFDTSINKPVLMKRCDNYYYAYPSKTGWVFYRSRYLGERDKEIVDINFDDWTYKVLEIVTNETKKIRNENTNLRQALIDIREYIKKETKNMPDNGCKIRLNEILQIIDKVLGDDDQ